METGRSSEVLETITKP